jgi:hypothetical protein
MPGMSLIGKRRGLLLLAVLLVQVSTASSAHRRGRPRPQDKYIVIDAGSSGCRIHVYTITRRRGQSFPDVELPDQKLKTSTGLSLPTTFKMPARRSRGAALLEVFP